MPASGIVRNRVQLPATDHGRRDQDIRLAIVLRLQEGDDRDLGKVELRLRTSGLNAVFDTFTSANSNSTRWEASRPSFSAIAWLPIKVKSLTLSGLAQTSPVFSARVSTERLKCVPQFQPCRARRYLSEALGN